MFELQSGFGKVKVKAEVKKEAKCGVDSKFLTLLRQFRRCREGFVQKDSKCVVVLSSSNLMKVVSTTLNSFVFDIIVT